MENGLFPHSSTLHCNQMIIHLFPVRSNHATVCTKMKESDRTCVPSHTAVQLEVARTRIMLFTPFPALLLIRPGCTRLMQTHGCGLNDGHYWRSLCVSCLWWEFKSSQVQVSKAKGSSVGSQSSSTRVANPSKSLVTSSITRHQPLAWTEHRPT